jgi:hypothetical protein
MPLDDEDEDYAEDPGDSGWGAWQDPNGDTMFIADGQKSPVLVWVPEGDESREQVLAVFTSPDTAGLFQSWFTRSFEATALANQHLSTHVRGPAEGRQPFARTRQESRYPGRVDE